MIYYCVFFHKKKLVRLTLRQDLIPLSFIPHTGPLVALKVLPPNAPHSHQIRLVAFGMMLPDNLKMHPDSYTLIQILESQMPCQS